MVNNQNEVARILLEDEDNRNFLMMPVRQQNDSVVDVLIDSQADNGLGKWVSLNEYKGFRRKTYGYFLSLIDLITELCMGRNKKALDNLQDMFQFDTIVNLIKNRLLPYELRALFLRFLLHMHMDREPLEPLQIPSPTGVWNDLPPFMKDKYVDPTSI